MGEMSDPQVSRGDCLRFPVSRGVIFHTMPEIAPPLLVFLVDAFRHDFLSEDGTPNLAALAEAGVRRPLKPILGYSDAIRATFFTGRLPDETGYWMEYCYRPEKSPWQGLSRLAPLDRLPSDLTLRGMKLAASSTAMRVLARRRGVPHLSLRNIPFRALGKFDFTLSEPMTAPKALGYPSIFDKCTETGRPWAYLDASRVNRGGPPQAARRGARQRRADLRVPAPDRSGGSSVRH